MHVRTEHLHVCRPGGKGAEPWREENTNVADVDREVQRMEDVVDDTAGSHQTRVDRATYDTTKGIPGGGVKPVPEFL